MPTFKNHQFRNALPRESHFHLVTSKSIFIHSHVTGPFIPSSAAYSPVLEVYTSGACGVTSASITIDWYSSLGRAGSRFWSTLGVWAVGVVGVLFAEAWRVWDMEDGFSTFWAYIFIDRAVRLILSMFIGPYPHPLESLSHFTINRLPWVSFALTVVSLLPLPSYFLLGNQGYTLFSPLAGICVILATGLVWTMWGILSILMWSLGGLKKILRIRPEQPNECVPVTVTQCREYSFAERRFLEILRRPLGE